MNGNSQGADWFNLRNLVIVGAVLLVLLAIPVLWLTLRPSGQSELMPNLPTPTSPTQAAEQKPENVTFSELNEDPLAYLNQTVLVSGDFLLVDQSDCSRVSGPDIRWSLTSNNLQLDALGLERIVGLVPQGMPLTVQGIWRLYQGPLGCGKGPPRGTRWYLDARRILQPNPLVGEGGQPIAVDIRSGESALPALIETGPTLESGAAITPTVVTTGAAQTPVPTPTLGDQIVPTQTPLPSGAITPSATAPQSSTPVTSTATPAPSATIQPTGDIANPPTVEAGAGTPTITAEAPPIGATATETSGGGYPGPEVTASATPTATTDPYP